MRRALVASVCAALVGVGAWSRTAAAVGPDEALAPVVVRLPLDHDLFTEGAGVGAHFRMTTWADLSTAWPAPLNLRGAPDSVRLAGELTLPVSASGRTLHVVTAGYGPIDSKGVAAELDVVYAGGRVDTTRLLVGEGAWPAWAGATGRNTAPLVLGRNVGGDVLTAAVRSVPLEPGAPLARVVLRPRGGLGTYVLAVVVDPAELPASRAVADEAPPAGYRFDVPFARRAVLPAARGPVQAVRVDGEALRFADGRAARFWGVNLVGRGALPEPDRAAAVADAMVARGFDLVRLHHIDTETTLLNPRRREPDQPLAAPEMLDRLDRLHAALRERGVYQYVEMWTQRAFSDDEGVPGPEGVPVGNKYVGALWPEWRAAQKAWFAAVWDRTNPYTGLRYADDPAVALVELNNENSLVTAWASGALEKLPVVHRRRADTLWNDWLRRRYGTDAAVSAAWSGGGRAGLQEGETLLIGSVVREPNTRARAELFPTRRAADLVAFYAELEAAYYADLQAFVRGLGFRAPTICSTAFSVPHADRQLAACDVIDVHAYWDPIGESTAFTDRSLLDPHDRWFERAAGCQAGKPCTLSEVNHSWPNRYAHEAPLAWATLAARQGIDAVLWFAWSHTTAREAPDGPHGALDLEGRFSTDVQLESAGAVYRAVPEAPVEFTRWWSDDALERDLAEGPGLWVPEMVGWTSWLSRRIRVAFGEAPPVPGAVVPQAGTTVAWSPGRLVVDGPGVAVVVGRAVATDAAPDPGRLRITSDRFVAASLVAGYERGCLLTIVGRTDRLGTRWTRGVPGLALLGGGPAELERLAGRAWAGCAGRATWLGPDGAPVEGGRARRRRGGVDVGLDATSPWVWIE